MQSAVWERDEPSVAARAVGGMRPGDHLCLTVIDACERDEILGAYAGAGLAAGDKVLFLTDATDRADVLASLDRQGVDPEAPLRSGQLVVAAAAGVYVPKGRFDPEAAVASMLARAARARSEGYRCLRVAAEMGWALRGLPGSEGLLDYEGSLRPALVASPAMAICQYDPRVFHAAALANAARAHGAVVTVDAEHDDGLLRVTRTFQPPGLRVEGEVDATTVAALEQALAMAAARCPGDVHADLGALDFIDLAGLRAIVAAAGALGGERVLALDPVRPHLRRLLRLVGWDHAPGLRLGGDVE